jgi:hypothetical protein
VAQYTLEVPDQLVNQVGEQFVIDVIAHKIDEILTLIRKQGDYGPDNIARCPIGPINGLIVRLFDKISRLAHLNASGLPPNHESLADTGLDIANYGTIVSMVLTAHWPHLPEDL